MKKKAFTLTELLVVVVIIGTLAAVVLPKFTQVLESRRTTEAENIMRAVRSEQEARCTLDKNYTAQASELASFPANEGNNYTYVLNDRGIFARSRHKNYTLRMPSYRTGEICCDGDDCGSLGKGYSACIVRVVADECAATDVPVGPEPEPEPEPGCQLKDSERSCSEVRGENWSGTIEYIVNADCTGYIEKSFCSCALPAKSPEPCGAGQTGNITWTIDSENCTYVKQENCTQQVCEEGEERNVVQRCDYTQGEKCVTGKWESFKGPGTKQPDPKYDECPTHPGTQVCFPECDDHTGEWEFPAYKCSCDCPQSWDQDCDVSHGIWDERNCSCSCPQGTEWKPDGTGGHYSCQGSSCPTDCGHAEQNPETCECYCPPGYTYNGHGDCVCGTQADWDDCHYGVDEHSRHGGEWSFTECKCICNTGYQLSTTGRFCSDIPGGPENGDDCWPEGPWCMTDPDDWHDGYW